MAVLGLFRLAHAKQNVNVESVEFKSAEGKSTMVTIAHDGRISWWHKSVLDIEGDVTYELLSLREYRSAKNGG